MIVTVLDTETTGKFTKDHRIIEASFRKCDMSDKDNPFEIENILMRFDPKRNIDAKAQMVHGIPIGELKGEPTMEDRAKDIVKIIETSDILVAHNLIGFDAPFLSMELERCGEKLPDIKMFDTMLEGSFATDLGKSPRLEELAWSLSIVFDTTRAHKGDYDTAILRDCLFEGYRLGWFTL